MVVYPGGSHNDPNALSYQFFYNYFSDLGLVKTIRGESNIISRILFTSALTFVGITLILFFISLPTLFTSKKSTKWLSCIASANGVLSAIGYIGIGFAPADIYITLHTIFVYFSFTSLIPTTILYAVAIFLEGGYPNFYAWIYLLLTTFQLIYLVILFGGSTLFSSDINYPVQVITQKIIVYAEIGCFSIQAFGAWSIAQKQTSPLL